MFFHGCNLADCDGGTHAKQPVESTTLSVIPDTERLELNRQQNHTKNLPTASHREGILQVERDA
jgi:hypothetical protein